MDYEYLNDYSRHFADVAEPHFQTRMYTGDTIRGWGLLVKSLEEGYDDVPPEFEHDMIFRETIEIFIVEKSLMLFLEHLHFLQCIQQIDSKFLEVTRLIRGTTQWKLNYGYPDYPLGQRKPILIFLGKIISKKGG